MSNGPITQAIEHLRRGVRPRDGVPLGDGELLGRFIDRSDERALAALVERHGPMVWGVCRRLLSHHDAEDAFQATFIILVRKATSVAPRELVGNWLYGVARQTALHARRAAARRGAREVQVTKIPDPESMQPDPWSDVRPLLDQELGRLPDIYRTVVVLCDLEGRTRKDVARQLDVPEGTVAGRLARARVLLAQRLARRGVTLPAGALATALAQNAAAGVPTSVVLKIFLPGLTTAGGASPPVAALTEGVLTAMLVNKLKAAVALALVVWGLAAGATVFAGRAAWGDDQRGVKEPPTSAPGVSGPAVQSGPWVPFEDTPTHVKHAKDIVIAECLSDTPASGLLGLAPFEVKVVAVIKGDRKLGKLRLHSDGLKKGGTYLLTNYGSYDKSLGFATNGELAEVELPPTFDLGTLKGKTTTEQVQAAFDARWAWVERELELMRNEKKVLDKSKSK